MSSDLQVVIVILVATIVPWLLWVFTAGRHDPDRNDLKPGPPDGAAGSSTATREGLDGPFRSNPLLQLRPDGVVLDWQDEPSMAGPASLSVTPHTDSTALR